MFLFKTILNLSYYKFSALATPTNLLYIIWHLQNIWYVGRLWSEVNKWVYSTGYAVIFKGLMTDVNHSTANHSLVTVQPAESASVKLNFVEGFLGFLSPSFLSYQLEWINGLHSTIFFSIFNNIFSVLHNYIQIFEFGFRWIFLNLG